MEPPKRFASMKDSALGTTLVLGETRDTDQASAAPAPPKTELGELNPALIRMIMDTGVGKDEAIAALVANDGDADNAVASLEHAKAKVDRPAVLDTVEPMSATEQSKVIKKAAGKGKGKGKGKGRRGKKRADSEDSGTEEEDEEEGDAENEEDSDEKDTEPETTRRPRKRCAAKGGRKDKAEKGKKLKTLKETAKVAKTKRAKKVPEEKDMMEEKKGEKTIAGEMEEPEVDKTIGRAKRGRTKKMGEGEVLIKLEKAKARKTESAATPPEEKTAAKAKRTRKTKLGEPTAEKEEKAEVEDEGSCDDEAKTAKTKKPPAAKPKAKSSKKAYACTPKAKAKVKKEKASGSGSAAPKEATEENQEETPEQKAAKERKAKYSRKSAAYHRAKKLALQNGSSEEDAVEKAKAALVAALDAHIHSCTHIHSGIRHFPLSLSLATYIACNIPHNPSYVERTYII